MGCLASSSSTICSCPQSKSKEVYQSSLPDYLSSDNVSLRLLAPILEKRLRDMETSGWQPTPDLMQFVLDATKNTGEGRSLDYQVNAIIGTGRAGLFTTGLTVYHLVYDLAVHPEYIAPLRQEMLELGDVPFTRANINKLSKLDSFIRESQRWSKLMLGRDTPIVITRESTKLIYDCLQWARSAKSSMT